MHVISFKYKENIWMYLLNWMSNEKDSILGANVCIRELSMNYFMDRQKNKSFTRKVINLLIFIC